MSFITWELIFQAENTVQCKDNRSAKTCKAMHWTLSVFHLLFRFIGREAVLYHKATNVDTWSS